jgi:hypothetical protein
MEAAEMAAQARARVRLLFTRERMCAVPDDVYSQLMGLEPDAMALVPLVAAAGFLVGEVRQHGLPAVVALALAAADGRGRPGPGEVAEGSLYVGAYPSGATQVVALALHLLVRAVTDKHWATDIVGSYLLAAGAFLLAGAFRARPGA